MDGSLWDLENGTSVFLPSVRDVKLDGDVLSFTNSEGEADSVSLAHPEGLKDRAWYRAG